MPIFTNVVLDKESFLQILQNNTGTVIFKFSAEWCVPCKRVKPFVTKLAEQSNCNFYEIDVDDNIDLFAYFKRAKIVPAIPAFLCYYASNTNFVPNKVYIGSDVEQIAALFK
jgi:thiol-disulfide isomerase/thioredoxin